MGMKAAACRCSAFDDAGSIDPILHNRLPWNGVFDAAHELDGKEGVVWGWILVVNALCCRRQWSGPGTVNL
jgi:hypothetical protein